MNREIKFRVWDGEKMWLTETLTVNDSFTELRFYNNPNCIKWGLYDWLLKNREVSSEHKESVLMQFTGLKDKNGKEVYEGDILENLSVVKFSKGRFHPVYNGGQAEDEEDDFKPSERLVIGNIYEDPDLLK